MDYTNTSDHDIKSIFKCILKWLYQNKFSIFCTWQCSKLSLYRNNSFTSLPGYKMPELILGSIYIKSMHEISLSLPEKYILSHISL